MTEVSSIAELRNRIEYLEKQRKHPLSSSSSSFSSSSSSSSSSAAVARVEAHLRHCNLLAFWTRRVPADYYQRSLEDRASLLNCGTDQLCKTILLENSLYNEEEDGKGSRVGRFFAVVVQYVCKIDAEKLRDVIRKLHSPPLPRKRVNLRLVASEVSEAVTGFSHNAVSPFGMLRTETIPVIICSRITRLKVPFVYLGGGETDLKIGLSVTSLIEATNPVAVTEISAPRPGLHSGMSRTMTGDDNDDDDDI